MACMYCRITGKSRSMPKAHYPPLIPMPKDDGRNVRRVFCKITALKMEKHNYNPKSEEDPKAKKDATCRVMSKSKDNEKNHYVPAFEDMPPGQLVVNCRYSKGGVRLALLNGENGSEAYQALSSALSVYSAGGDGLVPVLGPDNQIQYLPKDELDTLPDGHGVIYSVYNQACSVDVSQDLEKMLTSSNMGPLRLSADKSQLIIETEKNGLIYVPVRALAAGESSSEELTGNSLPYSQRAALMGSAGSAENGLAVRNGNGGLARGGQSQVASKEVMTLVGQVGSVLPSTNAKGAPSAFLFMSQPTLSSDDSGSTIMPGRVLLIELFNTAEEMQKAQALAEQQKAKLNGHHRASIVGSSDSADSYSELPDLSNLEERGFVNGSETDEALKAEEAIADLDTEEEKTSEAGSVRSSSSTSGRNSSSPSESKSSEEDDQSLAAYWAYQNLLHEKMGKISQSVDVCRDMVTLIARAAIYKQDIPLPNVKELMTLLVDKEFEKKEKKWRKRLRKRKKSLAAIQKSDRSSSRYDSGIDNNGSDDSSESDLSEEESSTKTETDALLEQLAARVHWEATHSPNERKQSIRCAETGERLSPSPSAEIRPSASDDKAEGNALDGPAYRSHSTSGRRRQPINPHPTDGGPRPKPKFTHRLNNPQRIAIVARHDHTESTAEGSAQPGSQFRI